MQQRIGKDGKPFNLYKFKSLKDEFENGRRLGLGERVNGFTHFMRTRGLDELPQLFNVLKGDMSIVGPRPLPQEVLLEFPPDGQVFKVRPGLVSPYTLARATVMGEDDKEVKNTLDYEYASRDFSILYDIGVLRKLFMPIVLGKNAQSYNLGSTPVTSSVEEDKSPCTQEFDVLD